jgi:hypothetical protein
MEMLVEPVEKKNSSKFATVKRTAKAARQQTLNFKFVAESGLETDDKHYRRL